jgi:hypothetical protein
MTFVAGALGALAPEVIRWRQISRHNSSKRKPRGDFLLATLCYVLLAGFFSALIAQPTLYAAFITGLTFEYAVAGALKGGQDTAIEELGEGRASRFGLLVTTLRTHAAYLTHG